MAKKNKCKKPGAALRNLPKELEPFKFKKGNQLAKNRNNIGSSILTRIKHTLKERSKREDAPKDRTRFDDAAEAYVRQLEAGSFIHFKELIDREEGKVPNRIAGADGDNVKVYVGVPLDDDPEAP